MFSRFLAHVWLIKPLLAMERLEFFEKINKAGEFTLNCCTLKTRRCMISPNSLSVLGNIEDASEPRVV